MNRTPFFPSAAAVLAAGILGCGSDAPSAAEPADQPPARLAAAPHTGVRSLDDLGTFGQQHGFGFEINDRGEVAGRADVGPPNAPALVRAVFWSPLTGAVDLGTLGGANAETRALNLHGTVVGSAQKPGDAQFQRHPTVWTVRHGEVVEIRELGPFVNGQAEDVNDRGLVVGWSSPAAFGHPTAFRWTEADGLTPIPPLAGARSQAAGVNDAGDIAGYSTVSAFSLREHAVVWWADGTVTQIGSMGGNTSARSINDRREVAGFGQPCPGCLPHAFYWSEATGIVDIGTFGGVRSFAFEIDNHGRVAGWYETAAGTRHAFVWTLEGGKADLPSLGGASTSSGGINTRGQVTGRAEDASGTVHAVIWQLGPDPQ